jgi:glycerol-3-phosphate dehydrogenase (NAD(P)+)
VDESVEGPRGCLAIRSGFWFMSCEKISIVGSGSMAMVCAIILTQNGHEVSIWGASEKSIQKLKENRENDHLLPGVRIPDCVRLTSNDQDCFRQSTMILSAVPTQYLRSVWTRLAEVTPLLTPIVSVSKGIENDTLLRPTQLIAEVLKTDRSLAALSGPNIAAELARALPATAVVASADFELAKRVQSVFSTQWFRVYTNNDPVGVELAGATKNVIAIAAGILDGLNAGNNAKAMLVTRGLVEITRLGLAMGALETTFHGLAGLGDLLTTCVSPQGRNRQVGEQIGRGRALEAILAETQSVAEGVPTTRSLVQLAEKYQVQMPITQQVHEILFQGKNVLFALSDLMTRDPKPERVDFT